jgi:hypothetical protein
MTILKEEENAILLRRTRGCVDGAGNVNRAIAPQFVCGILQGYHHKMDESDACNLHDDRYIHILQDTHTTMGLDPSADQHPYGCVMPRSFIAPTTAKRFHRYLHVSVSPT